MSELFGGKRALQASRTIIENKPKPKGVRESLYRHIHVSVRTMDIIIYVLTLLLVACIAMGVIQGMK